jgi:hypothetical protein
MFRYQTSGRAKNDKLPEAIQFAKEVAQYINGRYPSFSVHVYSEIVEDFNNIYWCSDQEDIATIEKFRAQLRSDQGYWSMVFNAMEYFTEGSFHDTLMRSV